MLVLPLTMMVEPLESSPEYTLRKACQAFTTVTGMEFQAMGELEYYVISENDGLFPATDQRGYHESAPYAKFNDFRTECMSYIAQAAEQSAAFCVGEFYAGR